MAESIYNFNKYEKYLSPFGQKVMFNLYKLKTDNHPQRISDVKNLTNDRQRYRSKNKKVLNFEDSNNSHLLDNTSLRLEDGFEFEQIRGNSSVVTSSELVTVPMNNVINNQLLGKGDDIVDKLIAEVNNKEVFQESNNKTISINKEKHYNEAKEKQNLISWDNIFDSDLLVHVEDFTINTNTDGDVDNDKDITRENVSTFGKPETITSNIVDDSKINVDVCKRKIVETTNKIPKSIKKVNNKEVKSLRKEKYTKTVKKWLNNVNANTAFESENSICQNIDEPDIVSNGALDKLKHELVSDKGRSKRVVQAQLANKDGIMKFMKPKPVKSKNISNDNTNIECNKQLVSGKEATGGTVREKKGKSKFIAPIKTPLPIKDIVYSINIVNGDNINEFEEALSTDIAEVVMVLVYSNGFSQLNNHYTNDVCTPEGVMFLKYENYYYIKNFQGVFAKLLSKIIQNILICYDAKEILTYWMSQTDVECYEFNILDLKIGGCLINPDNPPVNFSALQKLLSYSPDFTIATDCGLQKTAWYMSLMNECAPKLQDCLKENNLWKVFVDLEMQVLPIIAGMEYRGIQVDLDKLKSMENILVERMKEVEKECYKAAGKTFQINSSLQVRNILYEELNLDKKCNIKIRETICKAKSTSEVMLRSLSSIHPLPSLILEYRRLHKAHSTFVAGIVNHARDGIVKPTWDQMAAVTGRISCNNPNLQAIPKAPFSLYLHPNDHQDNVTLRFRSVFVPRAGYELLAADFRHVECRVLAHATADASLARALAGRDLFAQLAAQWLNKSEEAVSSEERERTKRIVYASLYGAGPRTLADILQVGYDQALAVLASFNRTFPSLKNFGQAVVQRCAAQAGRLYSGAGRARDFPDLCSERPAARALAQRQAVNFVVQGTAADVCKAAMVRAAAALRQHAPAARARLLLQLHDELLWEVRAARRPRRRGGEGGHGGERRALRRERRAARSRGARARLGPHGAAALRSHGAFGLNPHGAAGLRPFVVCAELRLNFDIL